MQPDDEVCLCFHVTKRKIVNFVRVEKPRRVSQISECFGAGTGCGWCVPFLKRYFEQETGDSAASSAEKHAAANAPSAGRTAPKKELTAAEYAQRRAAYVRAGGGTPPPGATPLPEDEAK